MLFLKYIINVKMTINQGIKQSDKTKSSKECI